MLRYLLLLSVVLLLSGPEQARADSLTTRGVLAAQLATLNRQIDDAQAELSATPPPSACCCIGSLLLLPTILVPIVFYFVDYKPKLDKRRQLDARIQSLTRERRNVEEMMLQR